MKRIVVAISIVAALGACALGRGQSTYRDTTTSLLEREFPGERAGIAVVGSGGTAGIDRVTLLDSATARYVTVTRRRCADGCAPIDSASGNIAADDVDYIYTVAEREGVYSLRDDYGACESCSQAVITTAIFGNQRHKVIRSDRETTPEILGRVHVAIAEAIAASRVQPIASSERASR